MPASFLHLTDEMWIDIPVGSVVPRDHHRADRVANEQKFHLAAAIDKNSGWILCEEVGGFFRLEMFHVVERI